jgi:hypothetical protein
MQRLLSALLLLLAAPAFAAEGYVEALYGGEPVCLIGSVNGEAIAPLSDPEAAPPALGPAAWMLATLDGLGGSAEGTAPALAECGCMEVPQVALTPLEAMTGSAIATNLPLQPAKKLEQLKTDHPAYVEAARAWLDEKGLPLAPVRLTYVLRTDLEGDGTDEVILAGAYNAVEVQDADLSVGRYAFVLLRRVIDGAVVTTALEDFANPHPYEADDVGYGASAIDPVAIVDLTGDGTAEVVLALWQYESLAYTLYRLQDGALVAAAGCGCGC